MISIFDIFWITLFHFVCDFMFQSDRMAQNKSKSFDVLMEHTMIYSFAMMMLLIPFYPENITSWNMIHFYAINLVAHTITDYFSSKATSYFYEKDDRHNFFVVVGFDQFMHIIVLLASWCYLMT